ncbi:MAG: ABC transporter permease, partial [Chloroflexi bacterium]|nr:ABC transporter permease [Chloroflexota bacterium]
MVLKNLIRRKVRTLLTVLAISLGVAAIIALGALAEGMKAGYNSVLSGSKADFILSQPNSFDISLSSVDEKIGAELESMPEVSEVSGMLEGFVQTQNAPYFFVFGYPQESFSLDRFNILEGVRFGDPSLRKVRGDPLLLGAEAAKVMKKSPGDTIRLGSSAYRVIGIYQTGDAFEDGGAVISLENAQELLGKPRQVSLFYIKLKDSTLGERFITRVKRIYTDLSISTTSEFADSQMMDDSL